MTRLTGQMQGKKVGIEAMAGLFSSSPMWWFLIHVLFLDLSSHPLHCIT